MCDLFFKKKLENMLINIAIICLIQSTLAIFHHHKALPHNRIYVCLTPPNTMYKVQKHIAECQNEVKSNIFHEAFSLIHHTAFHHPHDHHATIEYKDEHDDFAHRNFTLTEQEILKFFENHDHSLKTVDAVHPHDVGIEDLHLHDANPHIHSHEHHAIDDDLHAHPHSHPHHSIDIGSHAIDEHSHLHHHPTLNEHLHQPHVPQSIVHYPHPNFNEWQQQQHPSHLANIFKKTDATQQNDKPDGGDQRLLKAITTKRNPYTYFDINTGETAPNQEQLRSRRSDIHEADIHAEIDHHHHHADADHHHHTDIHPTTASFKDKRIAGCLMHCLYEKDHAIDPHTGYPTLDGLVNFYSDGVHEHGFFMTTLRAVDTCLKGASHKYHINRHVKPDAGVSCDLAFDIFDCVSDHITEYCTKHHYHDDYFHKGHHHDYYDHDHHHHHQHPVHTDHHAVDDHHGHYEEEYHDDYYYS